MASEDDNNKTVISTATPSAVEAGTRILGTFEISELIATGGMGEVYRGFNIHTNQSVAIKIVLAALAHDEKIISLFQKEATVLGELHQDAIVRYNIFTIDPAIQRACLVMEFVEGRSMADYIEDGPMPVDDVKTLMRRIAPGLQKAHDLGVVHRDLSPDNVIVQNGDVAQAKIIDFGIAKSESIGGGTLLGGQFAGKYNYVSPEQLGRFKGVVTGQSDIYSLGLVAAAACLGEPLYMGDNPGEAVDRRSDVPDLSGVHDEVRPLLEKMLQPDPANRPSTMAQVIEMLENPALLYDAGVQATPVTPPISVPPVAPPGAPSAPPGYQPPVSQPPQYGFTTPPTGAYAPPASVPPQPQAPQTQPPAYGTAPPMQDPYATAPPQQQPTESESPFGPPVTPARPAKGTTVPPHTSAPTPAPLKKKGKGGLIAALVLLLAVGGGAGAYFGGLLGPTGEVDGDQFADAGDTDIDDDDDGGGSDLPSSPPVDSSQTVPSSRSDDTPPPLATDDQVPPGTDTAADNAPPPPPQPPQDTETAGTDTVDNPRVPTDTSPTAGTILGGGDVVAALPTPPADDPPPKVVKSDLDKIGERIEWVKDYPLPTCVHAAILGATTESFAIEGYATSADPFWQLLRDFESAHGTEPDIGVRLIKSSQCSLIGFLKDMVDSPESSPRLSLDKDVLKSGEPIRGRVELINGRTIWLLLVDAQGGTYDLSSRLRPQEDGTATFALALRPNALGGADELVPQMIVAVASNAPIANAAAPPGTPSTVLLPLVQTELRNKGTTAAAAVGYFRFDTE